MTDVSDGRTDRPKSDLYRFALHAIKKRLSFSIGLAGPELAAWAVPNITDVAADEAAHLIYAADKNRDAVLSVEEILNEYDLFVGSAATDYGQHLNDEL